MCASSGLRSPARARRVSLLEILLQQGEQHSVLPLPVPEVRAPLDAFPHEAGTLGVADRSLVESVAGELETMEAELEDQVALQELRRLGGDPAAAERREDGEAAEVARSCSPR